MTPGQTDVARRAYVRERLLPFAAGYFTKYPKLRSAMLVVAQYWADEADDAVHGSLVVSELPEPVLKGVRGWSDEGEKDPNLTTTVIKGDWDSGSVVGLWTQGWSSNSGAIPLWAAFADEYGSQEYESMEEVYSPAVMIYRHGGHHFLPMRRPQLDGIRAEWDSEED